MSVSDQSVISQGSGYKFTLIIIPRIFAKLSSSWQVDHSFVIQVTGHVNFIMIKRVGGYLAEITTS